MADANPSGWKTWWGSRHGWQKALLITLPLVLVLGGGAAGWLWWSTGRPRPLTSLNPPLSSEIDKQLGALRDGIQQLRDEVVEVTGGNRSITSRGVVYFTAEQDEIAAASDQVKQCETLATQSESTAHTSLFVADTDWSEGDTALKLSQAEAIPAQLAHCNTDLDSVNAGLAAAFDALQSSELGGAAANYAQTYTALEQALTTATSYLGETEGKVARTITWQITQELATASQDLLDRYKLLPIGATLSAIQQTTSELNSAITNLSNAVAVLDDSHTTWAAQTGRQAAPAPTIGNQSEPPTAPTTAQVPSNTGDATQPIATPPVTPEQPKTPAAPLTVTFTSCDEGDVSGTISGDDAFSASGTLTITSDTGVAQDFPFVFLAGAPTADFSHAPADSWGKPAPSSFTCTWTGDYQ